MQPHINPIVVIEKYACMAIGSDVQAIIRNRPYPTISFFIIQPDTKSYIFPLDRKIVEK